MRIQTKARKNVEAFVPEMSLSILCALMMPRVSAGTYLQCTYGTAGLLSITVTLTPEGDSESAVNLNMKVLGENPHRDMVNMQNLHRKVLGATRESN